MALSIPAERSSRPCAISRAMTAARDAGARIPSPISVAGLAAAIDAEGDGTAMADVRHWLVTNRA
ncbi:hypothetical protein [Actinomadura fibrosa]|uniref:hypothetical protein n=1 Tax=Actinomadura fibrosa TaxID=111802 RepID=UPI001A955747|nr:hypothetical protein [Actinomadura fibrosa]